MNVFGNFNFVLNLKNTLLKNTITMSYAICNKFCEFFLVSDQRDAQFRPAHDKATDVEWQLPEVVLTQFVSPDDEHEVLETCREFKYK